MIGLKCGMVKLLEHQMIWDKSAKDVIILLKSIWDKTAIDIQHIGSTSIPSISAKPIIDIVVGVASLEEAKLYLERLEQCGIVFRGQDVPKQLLLLWEILRKILVLTIFMLLNGMVLHGIIISIFEII